MENVSAVTSFILTAYTELEEHRYLYFVFFLLVYMLTLLANSVLILVICIDRGLHEPMYLFICNLAVNELYGSTSLLPSILCHLLSHNYEISLTFCLLQIFCLHLYGSVDFTILAVMGYDRYVAICRPLHYHLLMPHRKVCTLILTCWIYPCILFGLFFMLTVQRTFCGRIIERMHCLNSDLTKLSCFEISIQSIVGLFVAFLVIVPQLLMILFSYAQIFKICLFASKESQRRALQTCTPHVLAVVGYALGAFFEVIQSRSNNSHVLHKAHMFYSLYSLVFTPIFNPVVYGICIQTIRVRIYKLFSGKTSKLTPGKVVMK
ncbi:olfactory receptor 142-like [Anguilla anguilla]|uniref:olfactory receptor 142-like n=1 Tax=Anguilla anguilla TaxID=7936 RepID=UPI0015B3749B|nr:olfactory receptor 142-like [Anguilla anguilla]XP_035242284.1 olfactory receptor 142-like [Anguilla anguilla]